MRHSVLRVLLPLLLQPHFLKLFWPLPVKLTCFASSPGSVSPPRTCVWTVNWFPFQEIHLIFITHLFNILHDSNYFSDVTSFLEYGVLKPKKKKRTYFNHGFQHILRATDEKKVCFWVLLSWGGCPSELGRWGKVIPNQYLVTWTPRRDPWNVKKIKERRTKQIRETYPPSLSRQKSLGPQVYGIFNLYQKWGDSNLEK